MVEGGRMKRKNTKYEKTKIMSCNMYLNIEKLKHIKTFKSIMFHMCNINTKSILQTE